MIIGVGTDIIEIRRVKQAVERTPLFIKKIFTEKEQNFLREKGLRSETIAGNFAAKEAVSKALGTGFSKIRPNQIEITRDSLGKPVACILSDEILQQQGPFVVHLSISHCKTYAVAFATIERRNVDEINDQRGNEKN